MSASVSSGNAPTQNFAHNTSPIAIGLERSNHQVRPSRLMLGKTKRAAIDASTKPASARFKNGITFRSSAVIPVPFSGKYRTFDT